MDQEQEKASIDLGQRRLDGSDSREIAGKAINQGPFTEHVIGPQGGDDDATLSELDGTRDHTVHMGTGIPLDVDDVTSGNGPVDGGIEKQAVSGHDDARRRRARSGSPLRQG